MYDLFYVEQCAPLFQVRNVVTARKERTIAFVLQVKTSVNSEATSRNDRWVAFKLSWARNCRHRI